MKLYLRFVEQRVGNKFELFINIFFSNRVQWLFSPTMFFITFHSRSDICLTAKENQDSWTCQEKSLLIVVREHNFLFNKETSLLRTSSASLVSYWAALLHLLSASKPSYSSCSLKQKLKEYPRSNTWEIFFAAAWL